MLPYNAARANRAHLTTHSTVRAWPDLTALGDAARDYVLDLIPVVTFLAPLASNFEGLKDR